MLRRTRWPVIAAASVLGEARDPAVRLQVPRRIEVGHLI